MLSPKPTETSPDPRTGLCILAATEITIIKSPQGSKNKKTELSFYFPGINCCSRGLGAGAAQRLRGSGVLGQLLLFVIRFGSFSKTEVEVPILGPRVDLNK